MLVTLGVSKKVKGRATFPKESACDMIRTFDPFS